MYKKTIGVRQSSPSRVRYPQSCTSIGGGIGSMDKKYCCTKAMSMLNSHFGCLDRYYYYPIPLGIYKMLCCLYITFETYLLYNVRHTRIEEHKQAVLNISTWLCDDNTMSFVLQTCIEVYHQLICCLICYVFHKN